MRFTVRADRGIRMSPAGAAEISSDCSLRLTSTNASHRENDFRDSAQQRNRAPAENLARYIAKRRKIV